MVRCLGYWWNDKEIEVYEVEGVPVALSDWNGEEYMHCWEVKDCYDEVWFEIVRDGLSVKPVYECRGEDEYEITDFVFS